MSRNTSMSDALKLMKVPENSEVRAIVESSGVLPNMIKDVSIISDHVCVGVKPSDFIKEYSSAEFDLETLKATFVKYCKDYNNDLVANVPSRALDFSSKILFEFGPMMRSEKKGRGDKAVRFRFVYTKTEEETDTATGSTAKKSMITIKTVIVSTFKDQAQTSTEQGGKLVLTMKQATLLAMFTFLKAAKFAYTNDTSILMTPLCGAIFSKTSIPTIAQALTIEAIDVVEMLNASTCPSGHNLVESNMACAIVAAIAGTKGMTNKGGRDQIITKVIKQYSAKHKEYDSDQFNIFAAHALGGVPPGLDSSTLVDNYKNVQVNARSRK